MFQEVLAPPLMPKAMPRAGSSRSSLNAVVRTSACTSGFCGMVALLTSFMTMSRAPFRSAQGSRPRKPGFSKGMQMVIKGKAASGASS